MKDLLVKGLKLGGGLIIIAGGLIVAKRAYSSNIPKPTEEDTIIELRDIYQSVKDNCEEIAIMKHSLHNRQIREVRKDLKARGYKESVSKRRGSIIYIYKK